MHASVPLYYSRGGDELATLTWTKALIDDGWYLTISHLGAPFAMSFGDFPVPNLLHLIILRLITFITHSASLAVNVYFLAGFPLIAMVSAYAFRRLGVSWAPALAMALLYSALPYRFQRYEAHLFYAQYYLTPILVLAVFWVFRGHELFDLNRRRPTRDGCIFIIGLLAVSWDNEYSAVFGMLFLALAACASLLRTRSWRGTMTAAAGILVILVGVEVELLPTTVYEKQHGRNAAAIVRSPEASQVYALTFAQLVLPIEGHRIAFLERRREHYDAGLPMFTNENSSVTLGTLGALGFVGSLAALLLVRRQRFRDAWGDLARLNLAAFLLTTFGGVGAIITYYFVPELRAYNRISPLIAFISFTIVGFALDAAGWKLSSRTALTPVWYGGLALIVILATLDQTSVSYIPAYAADFQAYTADGAFAATIEKHLPANASVYQLPHVLFPEGPPVVQLGSWDQEALYLQSHTLHYSFGATRGRVEDAWQLNTDDLPVSELIERLVVAGFDGLLIYRNGYADHGFAEEAALKSYLGEPPLVQDGGAIAFFDLSKLRARYVADAGATQAANVRVAATAVTQVENQSVTAAELEVGRMLNHAGAETPAEIIVKYGSSCYGPEAQADTSWHWCGSSGEIMLTNGFPHSVAAQLKYSLTTSSRSSVVVTVDGVDHIYPSSPQGSDVKENIQLPTGTTRLSFRTSAPPLVTPTDPRHLVIQFVNFRVVTNAK